MKRFVNAILLSITSVLLLTGCTGILGPTKKDGASTDNLDDEVIISQIKERMKEEMNRIGFEVDLENYKFYPYVTQTGATSGTVTMYDKRYPGYGSLEVYRGTFGSKKENKSIDKSLVATNPIIFVMNGYQDYTVKHIYNNKELGNDVEGALKATGGKMTEYSSSFSYDGSKETESNTIRVSTEEELLKDIAVTSFLFSTTKNTTTDFVNYFKGKDSKKMDYQEMTTKFHLFSKVGIYIDVTEEERETKQKEMKKYYNSETLVIVLTTTTKALVEK